MSSVDYLSFLRDLAAKTTPTIDNVERLEWYRHLAKFSPAIVETSSDANLDLFRSLVLKNPDHLRAKFLGINALRKNSFRQSNDFS